MKDDFEKIFLDNKKKGSDASDPFQVLSEDDHRNSYEEYHIVEIYTSISHSV